jgi:WD40 repeat protein
MMGKWSRKVAVILLFLAVRQAVLAAPISPPRKINARSPQLNLLDPERLSETERRPWHPTELVAILGDQRGRHWQYLESVSYSQDGKRIATLSRGRVYIWEMPGLRFQAVLPIDASFMQFVPERNSLFTCGKDGIARLWDMRKGKPRSQVVMRGILGDFSHLALSPDGSKLVVSTQDGFNFDDLNAVPPKGYYLKLGEDRSLLEAAFSPNSRSLATWQAKTQWFRGWANVMTTSHEEVTLWDVSGDVPKVRCKLTGPSCQWGPFAFSSDGKTLVCGANVWDLSRDKPRFRGAMNDQEETVLGCVFLPGDRHTITAGYKDSQLPIRLRDMQERAPQIRQTLPLSDRYCRGMALSPDADYFAVGEGNCLHLWRYKNQKLQVPPPTNGHTQEIKALSFGACGNLLVTIGGDESLRLWDLDGPRPHERLFHKRKWASWDTVALSPDGTKLAAGFRNSSGLTLWEVSASGLRVLAERDVKGDALAFSPDSKTLFVGGGLNAIEVIDVAKPKEVSAVLRPGRDPEYRSAHALAISPDGQTLAAAIDNEIELWQRTENNWKRQSIFSANILHSVTSMSFGPRGTTLLVGGGINKQGPVRLFDVSGEKPSQILDFASHKAAVVSVSASSNGKLFASADEGGRVLVWSASGEQLHDWTFPGPVHSVAFAPDGKHLALGNGDGTVYILRLSPPGPAKEKSPSR